MSVDGIVARNRAKQSEREKLLMIATSVAPGLIFDGGLNWGADHVANKAVEVARAIIRRVDEIETS